VLEVGSVNVAVSLPQSCLAVRSSLLALTKVKVLAGDQAKEEQKNRDQMQREPLW
jgi:hypothetical protein